ncbi:hypothetical protein [Sodalinema gerasimenkoae]|nr:hypothetical protein [Sodalinema gerasimenkoae]
MIFQELEHEAWVIGLGSGLGSRCQQWPSPSGRSPVHNPATARQS